MRTLLIALVLPLVMAAGEENPFSSFNKRAYGQIKTWLTASAEKMPEENYGFRPTDSVRSFGQIIGHLADAQYSFCSAALGDTNPGLDIEKTKTSKADLIAALKDAFAYCDKAYDSITDAAVTQNVKVFGRERPKPVVLTANNMHAVEHYGNLVTYLRLKNIVPPSSDTPPAPAPTKETGSK